MYKFIGAAVMAVMLVACGKGQDAEKLAFAAVEQGALLVDVRTAEEFASGHLPGAINIPHGEIVEGLAALQTPKSARVVLYCRSGNRSGIATKSLTEAGFSKAMNAGAYPALKPVWDAAGS
ncbi:rhodanese-like domain-containing protein [Congregibacter litoralis]|uniref:Rhodanese-related protein sulfurtransferase n=1 Tax=Congregibacter litoralis KT71 TaxID=314285 RepID=A4A733_9GAMM|nr:rhodanese-like domain-containing protein [Congregibacter litoralis]EAQ98102.2 Rhodanese-related protein sulfurtransferase [Congregibacter litoralis KT71]